MKKIKIFFYFIFACLFAGCSALPPYPPELSQTRPVLQTSISKSTAIQPSTATSTITITPTRPFPTVAATDTPSPTPTSTPLPTTDPKTGIRTECLVPVQVIPKNNQPEGNLIFREGLEYYYLFNPVTGEHKQLGNAPNEDGTIWSNIEVSPNHTYMFYRTCSSKSGDSSCYGVIATANSIVKRFLFKNEWSHAYWLDNENLIIDHLGAPMNSIIILNPFKGLEREVILNVSNPLYNSRWGNEPSMVDTIDPTLTRAIYFDKQGSGRIILWDILAEKMLAWLPYPGVNDPVVIDYEHGWSPDGSQFITVSPVVISGTQMKIQKAEELFSIDRDGRITQLTHLSNTYGFVRVISPRWSPDGRYIAFWLVTIEKADSKPDDAYPRLVIFDMVAKEVIDLCISNGLPGYSVDLPVWSPNSKQIVFALATKLVNPWGVSLADIQNGFITSIDKDYSLEGWIVNEK
jgi:hypothetical protein